MVVAHTQKRVGLKLLRLRKKPHMLVIHFSFFASVISTVIIELLSWSQIEELLIPPNCVKTQIPYLCTEYNSLCSCNSLEEFVAPRFYPKTSSP